MAVGANFSTFPTVLTSTSAAFVYSADTVSGILAVSDKITYEQLCNGVYESGTIRVNRNKIIIL